MDVAQRDRFNLGDCATVDTACSEIRRRARAIQDWLRRRIAGPLPAHVRNFEDGLSRSASRWNMLTIDQLSDSLDTYVMSLALDDKFDYIVRHGLSGADLDDLELGDA